MFFKWFVLVVCDYIIKYQNDIRWVSQNTTLYYRVRCQKIDKLVSAHNRDTHMDILEICHTILPISTRFVHNRATPAPHPYMFEPLYPY